MPDVVYVSSDIDVQIDSLDPVIDVQIDSMDPVEVEFDDSTLIYGNLPRGGTYNNILVKLSDRDYHSGWKTLSELGFISIYYDSTQNWNEQTTLISESGALYIYNDYTIVDGKKIPNVKIGDGLAYLVDLPFVSDDIRPAIIEHIRASEIHVTAQEKELWNNKVSVIIDPNDSNNLIFTTGLASLPNANGVNF